MHKTALKPISLGGILLTTALLLPVTAQAMRCGNHLISKGDTQAKVLRYCGEPVQAKRSLGLRSGVYLDRWQRGDPARDLTFSTGKYIPYGRREVVVEDWVFNFGPSRLMRQVTFENGIVTKVKKLDYGYRD
jgi:hypothetical protein